MTTEVININVYNAIMALSTATIGRMNTVREIRGMVGQQEWIDYAGAIRPFFIDGCTMEKGIVMVAVMVGDDGDSFFPVIKMPLREFKQRVKDA